MILALSFPTRMELCEGKSYRGKNFMNIHANLNHCPHWGEPVSFSRYPIDLIEEIKEYKRQTERLGRIYDLHRRLGETLDLHAMVEAFSVWLAPYLDHRLVAYRHFESQHLTMACSCHGEYRDDLLSAAMKLLQKPTIEAGSGCLGLHGLNYHVWPLSQGNRGSLLIFHDEPQLQSHQAFQMLEEVLEDLHGPLMRTLAYEELYNQARRDALTGLVNRRVFEERIIQELANAERYGSSLVLACLDLDHFKSINDTLGHAEGDAVLKQVSKIFSDMVRDTDLLARVGGDEFALILPNTSLENGRQLLNRLCQAIADQEIHAPNFPSLGVSVGLAVWHEGLTFKMLWDQADTALYRAKSAGRSQVMH